LTAGPQRTHHPLIQPRGSPAICELTDFRADLLKIDIPTLVVRGTADRVLPFEATAKRLRDEQRMRT
jgi:pimeloyl-ACP methyl ester carboxylesterase